MLWRQVPRGSERTGFHLKLEGPHSPPFASTEMSTGSPGPAPPTWAVAGRLPSAGRIGNLGPDHAEKPQLAHVLGGPVRGPVGEWGFRLFCVAFDILPGPLGLPHPGASPRPSSCLDSKKTGSSWGDSLGWSTRCPEILGSRNQRFVASVLGVMEDGWERKFEGVREGKFFPAGMASPHPSSADF